MKIGFATNDWSGTMKDGIFGPGFPAIGAAGWYRMGLPALHLRDLGFETVVGRLVLGRKTGALAVATWADDADEPDPVHTDCDLVVVQRYMNADLAAEQGRAVAAGQVVVQDLDDWFWGLDPKNRAFHHSHPLVSPDANRNHYRRSLATASLVTVSTPYLADRLAGISGISEVEVIRNAVDVEVFSTATRERPYEALPVVGWSGVTQYRSGDLETLRGVLGPFLSRHGLAFHHAGHVEGTATAADALKLPASVESSTSNMVAIPDYPALLANFDLGIVPLADVPFNRAKSAIKGIEYAAAGIPFVAADTPEYRWLRDTHGLGWVAARPKEWTKGLTRYLPASVRADHGAGMGTAVWDLDIRARVKDWAVVYMDLLNR